MAFAMREGAGKEEVYALALDMTGSSEANDTVKDVLLRARDERPHYLGSTKGWVLVALQNAFWQLLNAASVEEGVVATAMVGGDTDTNAVICGAVLGAVHRVGGFPIQWKEAVLGCRPEAGRQGVLRPRPPEYWPNDFLDLATALFWAGAGLRRTVSRHPGQGPIPLRALSKRLTPRATRLYCSYTGRDQSSPLAIWVGGDLGSPKATVYPFGGHPTNRGWHFGYLGWMARAAVVPSLR